MMPKTSMVVLVALSLAALSSASSLHGHATRLATEPASGYQGEELVEVVKAPTKVIIEEIIEPSCGSQERELLEVIPQETCSCGNQILAYAQPSIIERHAQLIGPFKQLVLRQRPAQLLLQSDSLCSSHLRPLSSCGCHNTLNALL